MKDNRKKFCCACKKWTVVCGSYCCQSKGKWNAWKNDECADKMLAWQAQMYTHQIY